MSDKSVTLAAITGAHGVTGEVRLKLFGEGVESLKGFRAFRVSGRDAPLTVKKVRDDGKGGAIARFAEVADRNAAEALRGSLLTVPRDALPALAEGEYYHADLIGLAVVTDAGDAIGRVIAVQNFGATDIVEIEKEPAPEKGQKTFMVPMIAQAVHEWDSERLVISADFVDE